MEKINVMTEKQVKEFYDACPPDYDVEETRVFDMVSLQYVMYAIIYLMALRQVENMNILLRMEQY